MMEDITLINGATVKGNMKDQGLFKKYDVKKIDKPFSEIDAIVLEWDDPIARFGIAAWAEEMGRKGFHQVQKDVEAKLRSYSAESSFQTFMSKESPINAFRFLGHEDGQLPQFASVRGVMLPLESRSLEFYDPHTKHYHSASFGDWVCWDKERRWVETDERFRARYSLPKRETIVKRLTEDFPVSELNSVYSPYIPTATDHYNK